MMENNISEDELKMNQFRNEFIDKTMVRNIKALDIALEKNIIDKDFFEIKTKFYLFKNKIKKYITNLLYKIIKRINNG